jgi:hypothetical protein
MTTFDQKKTYLGLDGRGRVTTMAGGPGVLADRRQEPPCGGTLVTVHSGDGDWKHWEMHPKGDEVLIVLEGSGRMIFERPDRNKSFDLAPGATLIVPARHMAPRSRTEAASDPVHDLRRGHGA